MSKVSASEVEWFNIWNAHLWRKTVTPLLSDTTRHFSCNTWGFSTLQWSHRKSHQGGTEQLNVRTIQSVVISIHYVVDFPLPLPPRSNELSYLFDKAGPIQIEMRCESHYSEHWILESMESLCRDYYVQDAAMGSQMPPSQRASCLLHACKQARVVPSW